MQKIGWIGTGIMGSSMAGHILNAGYELHIFNRTKSKAEELIGKGAVWHESLKDLSQSCDIIFTIIGTPDDVKNIYIERGGLIDSSNPGQILVDMTTTEPSLSMEIYAKAKLKGVDVLDAPVSGGDIGAKNGSLSIMVGGDKDIFDNVMPIFQLMGKNIIYEGESGKGQHTKLCNQILIAGTMIGVCESLLYGMRTGLDLNSLVASISKGAAGCRSLDNLAPRIIRGEYDTGFYVDHFVKDMGIVLKESENMNLNLPGLKLVNQLYINLQNQGGGKMGTQGLIKILKSMNNL